MPDITRRGFVALGGAALAAPARRPNIVFVCSDQHSGRILGCNGHPIVRTPNLDRLASRGVLFRNAYTGNPVCAPGRASMMTGRFASDVDSYCNSTPLGRVPTWGNRLREAGYFCWATGKLDLTQGADYGFQEVRSAHGHSQGPDITSLFRAPVCFRPGERDVVNGKFVDKEKDSDDRLADAAIECMRGAAARSGKPWAIYVGMHQPHPQWVAPRKYLEIYPPEKMPLPEIPPGYLESRHTMFQVLANFKNIQVPLPAERIRRARAAYLGMVSELDQFVGRILDATNLDNTLFLYTSDHGEMFGDHGLWLKNVLLENAARVPLIMAGAGLPRGRVVDAPVSHVDAVATLLDVAGAPRTPELRGHSLLGAPPPFVFSESHSEGNCTGSFMVRKGDWKYLYFTGDEPLLFNLRNDPGELHNLAVQNDIRRELHAHLTSLLDPDAVTERAFAQQERVLMKMVRSMKPHEFYAELEGRLGPAQARVLTNRHYRLNRPAA